MFSLSSYWLLLIFPFVLIALVVMICLVLDLRHSIEKRYIIRFVNHWNITFTLQLLKPGPPRQCKPNTEQNSNKRFQHFQIQPIKCRLQINEISTNRPFVFFSTLFPFLLPILLHHFSVLWYVKACCSFYVFAV